MLHVTEGSQNDFCHPFHTETCSTYSIISHCRFLLELLQSSHQQAEHTSIPDGGEKIEIVS